MKPARSVLSVVGVLLLVIAAGGPATHAQGGYPEPVDLYVNDFAGLLTPEHASAIRSLFADLRSDTGIEAVVVTIGSIHDYPTGDATLESFATNLFNTWGVGDKAKNNGVMILVAVRDREVRIEVGTGYESTLNAAMQAAIDEHMLPAFRRNDYSRGIYDGARAVVHELTGQWPGELAATAAPPPTRPVAATAPAQSPTRAAVSSSPRASPGTTTSVDPMVVVGGIITGGILVGAVVVAFGAPLYARYLPRRCPNCKTRMIRLDEVSDDVYLDSGQKLEEMLKSIDYDVWKCPNCNFHTLHGYSRRLSRMRECPKCKYRTLKVTSRTSAKPTYTSEGKEHISAHCHHCNHRREETITLSMLIRPDRSGWDSGSRPSDDSGSFGGSGFDRSDFGSRSSGDSGSRTSADFGGGKSSRDGASGKW